jgi:hypothetical protein
MNLNAGSVQFDLNVFIDFPDGKEVPYYDL